MEEVYTINTFCILNTAAGKFGFGKSSFSFKKRNKEKFSNWKYPIAKSNKTKDPPKLIYVMFLVIRNFQSLSSYFSITYIKILLLGEVDFLTAYFSTFIENK